MYAGAVRAGEARSWPILDATGRAVLPKRDKRRKGQPGLMRTLPRKSRLPTGTPFMRRMS